jgi:two-component system sensor histidine kinase/response regulator
MNELILIADDDVKHLKLFTDVLQAAGYQTLTIGDSRHAVELARSARPSLILMDVDLPGLDGYAAVKVLKDDPETRAIPVVAVTSLSMASNPQRVLRAGFDGCVGKPIQVRQLQSVVREHLGPARDQAASDQRRGGRSSPPQATGGPPDHRVIVEPGKVLVVDDEERNRRMLRDILEAQGHVVTLAEDGDQALAAAFADCPDVILLDVMMPVLDGFEVCRRLRGDPRTVHVPVLIVTALHDRHSMLTGIRAGANDFLSKPIDAEELRLRVANAIVAKHLYDTVQQDCIRLEALQALRDNLTAMIVHDMRSPLLAVSTCLQMLADRSGGAGTPDADIRALAQQSCQEVVDMVNSLLDVSRMEAGQMPLDLTRCDIQAIAASAVESVTSLARKKSVSIDLSGDSAAVVVDRDILRRVLVNLLGNAIHFSGEGDPISVRISATATSARVTVTDRGPGIPAEHRHRIFEKFGQIEPRKPGLKHSTGLGLTFCKLAVETHGGRIGVESQVGQGSTFWLTLPRS